MKRLLMFLLLVAATGAYGQDSVRIYGKCTGQKHSSISINIHVYIDGILTDSIVDKTKWEYQVAKDQHCSIIFSQAPCPPKEVVLDTRTVPNERWQFPVADIEIHLTLCAEGKDQDSYYSQPICTFEYNKDLDDFDYTIDYTRVKKDN